MAEHAEVKAKLTLDDAASEALEKVKGGFEHLGEKVKETGHELVAMAKQAAVFAIGFQLSGVIDSFKELGEELVHGAAQLQEENKELEGLLELSNQGESSFEELSEKAGELNERFEKLAIGTGNTKNVLIDAFGDIASRSTQSAEHSADMVEKMSMAAKNLPGGVATLANAWRDLETGVVRPRNAMVQLLRQTGVVAGSAKDVAKGLNAMMQAGKQEQVFALGEKAISKMADRMKDVPLTFNQMLTSLKGYREMFLETMGTPILKAIAPQFDKMREYLEKHREQILKLAETLGARVGEWVKKAAEMIQEGFEYLQTHADEIMDAIETGATALKDAIKFIVDHKELLIGIFVGMKGAQLAGGIASALPGIGAAAGQGVGSLMAQTGMGAGAAVVTAAGLAVIDATVLAELQKQTSALEKESGMDTSSFLNTLIPGSNFGAGAFAQTSDEVMNVKAAFEALNDPARQSAQDTKAFAQKVIDYADALKGSALSEEMQKEINNMKRVAEEKLGTATALEDAQKAMELAAVAGYDSDFSGPQLDLAHRFALTYAQMAAVNGAAADEAAKKILGGNVGLIEALGVTGDNVDEALKRLKALAGGEGAEGKLKMPPVTFSGANTFNIKQDFRDMDPDKILVLFRRDIAKNATSRISSRMGTAFGF